MFRLERIKEAFTEPAGQKEAKEDLYRRALEVEIFTGSLSEYSQMKGEAYDIIELRGSQKFLASSILSPAGRPPVLLIDAASLGATALVRYTLYTTDLGPHHASGIPVKPHEYQSEV